tara:strand:- start:1201 stop:2454 length:1254 start_codon:yes stop_codon:yes gene_type:complete
MEEQNESGLSVHMASNIELWPLSRLKPYEKNARTHSSEQVAQIANSITEFGFTNPILVDSKDGIIAGHGRMTAAQELNLSKVPVVVLDHLSDRQRRAYVLADNQLALNAGWDLDVLRSELKDLVDEDFNIDLIGFSDEELKDLMPEELEPEYDGDADAVPEPPEDPITKPGDLWILGEHRLLCGDSTNLQHIERLMNGKKADLWLTDPPYNVDYEGKTKEKLVIENDSMSDSDFRQFLVDVYTSADAVMNVGGVFYIWHADSEGFNFRGAAADMGWQVRQCLIWLKQSMVMGRQDYHWKHEPCLYGWKEGAAHLWNTDRKQTTVLEFDRPSRNKEHPTMKPVDLFQYQMCNSTKKGAIVLDSFGGSGTTLIAAERSRRKACLMELDPRYCDVIVKRWEEFTGKTAVCEPNSQQKEVF